MGCMLAVLVMRPESQDGILGRPEAGSLLAAEKRVTKGPRVLQRQVVAVISVAKF